MSAVAEWERTVLADVMAWYRAQKRGLAVAEADRVLRSCEMLEKAMGYQGRPAAPPAPKPEIKPKPKQRRLIPPPPGV